MTQRSHDDHHRHNRVRPPSPTREGYREFDLGGFHFRRDEFFAHVTWPTGSHVLSIDAFLRALQRDVAWEFFYGTVNFDGVIGTVNHYGTVDLFAGRYNDAYRKAELDHVETFDAPHIKATFAAMLTTGPTPGSTPSPARPRPAWPSASRTATTTLRSPATGSPRPAWSACRATSRSAPTPPTRSTACSPTSPRTSPLVEAEPGFEGEVAAFNLFAYLSRSDVTWNPSVVSVCKESLYCPTTEEYILPVIHGNDRMEWFLQLSDEIHWSVEDRDSGTKRANVIMRAGDICAMPGDIRHQGYSPKRSMLLVWENAAGELPGLIASGQAPSDATNY